MEYEVLNGQLQDNEIVLHINGRYIKPIMLDGNVTESNLKEFIKTKVNLAAFGITRFKLSNSAHRTINLIPF